MSSYRVYASSHQSSKAARTLVHGETDHRHGFDSHTRATTRRAYRVSYCVRRNGTQVGQCSGMTPEQVFGVRQPTSSVKVAWMEAPTSCSPGSTGIGEYPTAAWILIGISC